MDSSTSAELSTMSHRWMWEWRYTPCFLNLGTRWRWVVGSMLQSLYPWGNSSQNPLDRRLWWHHSQSECSGKDRYPYSCWEANPSCPSHKNFVVLFALRNTFCLLTLPFTSMMWGFSPGACVRDITVTAETCAMDRTVAAHCHGAPSSPQPTFAMQTITMSRWKPDPFFSLRSFLLTINLEEKHNVTFHYTQDT
jgi:hypothetical protein